MKSFLINEYIVFVDKNVTSIRIDWVSTVATQKSAQEMACIIRLCLLSLLLSHAFMCFAINMPEGNMACLISLCEQINFKNVLA